MSPKDYTCRTLSAKPDDYIQDYLCDVWGLPVDSKKSKQAMQVDERLSFFAVQPIEKRFSLVPTLSVAENIFLGEFPHTRFGTLDWGTMMERARKSLAELGVDIDPRTEVRELDVSEQQLTEIARVLEKDPRILLLDEPTSALSDAERERLFEIVERLRERDIGIVYITHQLREVPRVGQRVTVLRDGQAVDTVAVEEVDEDDLVRMMVGREVEEQYTKQAVERGRERLRIEGLSVEAHLFDLSFELHEGEILGVFGLMGAGQTIMTRALFGLRDITSGRIYVDGEEVPKVRTPWSRH